MSKMWWLRRPNGEMAGGFSGAAIHKMAAEGVITPETELCLDGKWYAAKRFKGMKFGTKADTSINASGKSDQNISAPHTVEIEEAHHDASKTILPSNGAVRAYSGPAQMASSEHSLAWRANRFGLLSRMTKVQWTFVAWIAACALGFGLSKYNAAKNEAPTIASTSVHEAKPDEVVLANPANEEDRRVSQLNKSVATDAAVGQTKTAEHPAIDSSATERSKVAMNPQQPAAQEQLTVAGILDLVRENIRGSHYEEVAVLYERALRLEPKNATVHNGYAWLLATSPWNPQRNADKALIHARLACDLSGFADPNMIDTLATANAAKGLFDEAVRWERIAILLSAEKGEFVFPKRPTSLLREMGHHLILFEARAPYVGPLEAYHSVMNLAEDDVEYLDSRLTLIHVKRAWRYRDQGKFRDAVEELTIGLTLYCNEPECWIGFMNRAMLHHFLCNYREAIADYSKYIEIVEKHPDVTGTPAENLHARATAYYLRASQKLMIGENQGAIEDARIAAEIEPSRRSSYNDIRKLASQSGSKINKAELAVLGMAAVAAIAMMSHSEGKGTPSKPSSSTSSSSSGDRATGRWGMVMSSCSYCDGKGQNLTDRLAHKKCSRCGGSGVHDEWKYTP